MELIWVPAHSGNPGNEAAHNMARGSIGRAVSSNSSPERAEDVLISFQEITQHFRLARRTLPPPHNSLTKAEEVRWRQLQTNTLPNPVTMHHIDPDQFKPDCSKCGQRATVQHIFWDCPADPPPKELQKLVGSQKWETLLASSALDVQVRVTARAEEVAFSPD